jgi:glycosyltransferase involved in cell wall biosynthesis
MQGIAMSHELNTKRVCVVSPLYHPSLGGLGRQAQLLTERLAEEGVDIFVIARRMEGMPEAAFSPKVKVFRAWSLGARTHTYEDVTPMNILISITFTLSCMFLLFRKRKEYDIVHFHGASLPLFCSLPLLRLLGKKVIAKVASSNLGIEAGSLRGRYCGIGSLMTAALKKADAFVATTSEIEERLLADGFPSSRIRRIPNFIDDSLFHPVPEKEKQEKKKRLLHGTGQIAVYSGRFIACKAIDVLLNAWSTSVREYPGARLVLLGTGPLAGEMKALAGRLGLGETVLFAGQVNNVADYLKAADLFVLPSLQEGMPNTLLEAMACGLPAVATRIGGVVDIIRDGENGLLVDPCDAAGMAAAITRLLGDPELTRRISSSALGTITDSYRLDRIVRRYTELLSTLSP